MRVKVKEQEKDFQTQTNEYAQRCIKSMREELDEQRERISSEGALSVEVRSGWYFPGGDLPNSKPTEYKILLGTGGPASQIRGELDEYSQPETAKFEYQDWFKPWTPANNLSDEEEKTLLEYAQQFYFGE